VPPTQEEAALLHAQWLSSSSEDASSTGGISHCRARDTRMTATHHLHPQQRNVHKKAFGGSLMRSAYELAWLCAAAFVNRPVVFLALDALSFHAPVPIGAMLSLNATVTYTNAQNGARQQVDCDADGQSAALGEGEVAAVT
jgi:acyl-coenzyme A thioesterase 9